MWTQKTMLCLCISTVDIENNVISTLLLATELKCTWILFKEKYLTSNLKKKIAAISPVRKVILLYSPRIIMR